MRKALVTGGRGFIGHHLAKRLLAEGFEIDVLDRDGGPDPEVDALADSGCCRTFCRDLRDGRALDGLPRDYHFVFHMAAAVGVQAVMARPYDVLRDNIETLARMIEFARTLDRLERFVFPSTSEVYAGTLQHFGIPLPTPESTALTVTDPAQPRTSYMLSKICGEALCQHGGVPFTIVRPHNVYGPRMGMKHVIPELLQRAHYCPRGGRLRVYSPRHRRTFCYVDDAVELIVRLASASGAKNATFNVGAPGGETSMEDLAGLIAEILGKPLEIEAGPDTPGSPARRWPDIARAATAASFMPAVPLAEGIRRTYAWYRAHVFEAARGPAAERSDLAAGLLRVDRQPGADVRVDPEQ